MNRAQEILESLKGRLRERKEECTIANKNIEIYEEAITEVTAIFQELKGMPSRIEEYSHVLKVNGMDDVSDALSEYLEAVSDKVDRLLDRLSADLGLER